ncbi:MAG: hypothetical protein J0G30_12230 [Actinomycetales bacterium]|nr:hypothetical protein [Actinomycetales bacterium]
MTGIARLFAPERVGSGRRTLLSVLASLAVLGFAGVTVLPLAVALPSTAAPERGGVEVAQDLVGIDSAAVTVVRDGYTVTDPPPKIAVAPAAGVPDPGTAKAIGLQMVLDRGWSVSEYDCLAALWDRESHWNVYAYNGSSGAYGIPQALPGEKMASAGADWQTNPATQIAWGLGYISARYGTPCGAWEHSESENWY